MKHFYYLISSSKHRKYGGCNEVAQIYAIRKNVMTRLGECRWCTAGYCGEESEVFQWLVENKFIAKKWLESSECSWRGRGYFEGEVEKHFKIWKIYDNR